MRSRMKGGRRGWMAVGLGVTALMGRPVLAIQEGVVEDPWRDWDARVISATDAMPPYEGKHRYFLEESRFEDMTAAATLLHEVHHMAPAEYPFRDYALRKHIECLTLLGEDRKNRGLFAEADALFASAVKACDTAIAETPDYPWVHYARGMACFNRRMYRAAAGDFEQAVSLAKQVLAGEPAEGDGTPDAMARAQAEARDMLFRAGGRLADARNRAFQREEAGAVLRAHYEKHSEAAWLLWDLGNRQADFHLQLGDYEAARQAYLSILEEGRYREYPQPYANLGYVAAALGEEAQVIHWLTESVARAPDIGGVLYPTLFIWAFTSPGKAREEAERHLRELLANAELSAWEKALLGFLLSPLEARDRTLKAAGDGREKPTAESDDERAVRFLERTKAELARRMQENEAPGYLLCEAWFFIGLRHERTAEATAEAGQRTDWLRRAMRAYQEALRFPVEDLKWEWIYARNRLRALAQELGVAARPGFTWRSGAVVVVEAGSLSEALGLRVGQVGPCLWHRAGQSGTRPIAAWEAYDPEPGDLLWFLGEAAGHPTQAVVVGAQLD